MDDRTLTYLTRVQELYDEAALLDRWLSGLVDEFGEHEGDVMREKLARVDVELAELEAWREDDY